MLDLLPATYEALDAAIAGDEALARHLGLPVAEGWTAFPEALPHLRGATVPGEPAPRWGSTFFVLDEPRTLVGIGGFKGAPSSEGIVEIGYAIAPSFRRRGLATEAARKLVASAFEDASVRAVDAQTLGETNPSTRVLERVGFRRIAELADPELGPLWHWRLVRP